MENAELWMSDGLPQAFIRLSDRPWPLDGAVADTQELSSVSSDQQGDETPAIEEPSSSLQTFTGSDFASSSQASPQTEIPSLRAFTDAGTYSFDGTGNHLLHPEWGAASRPLISIAPLAYADGVGAPTGGDRPNPRIISNALAQQDVSIPDPRGLTNFIWAWGQFLDHDLDLTPELSYEEAAKQNRFISIPVPDGDPYLDPSGTGTATIEMRDTVTIDGTGTDPTNPRQLPNVVTGWLDGSQVYGSSEERALALRSFSGGQLLVSDGNLLPLNTLGLANDNPTGRPPGLLFVAGDVRANENVVLSSLHTLFVREHNRLARELQSIHPSWGDEQLYQAARRINIAQIQSITYNEYLPTLLGVGTMPSYSGHDPSVDPGISRTFSTAAFRLGHTQLSSAILRLDPFGAVIPEGNLSLATAFFPGSGALQQAGIDPILRGLAAAASQRVDTEIISDVRNLLFGFGPMASARDLFAINIQRGRVNGLADYNTIRAAFGLPRAASFAEITSDLAKQSDLASLYGSVDSLDAFVGLLAEDLLPGASVGETIAAVLVDQFSRLRTADRLYFENILSPQELTTIQQTTLSDILRRNTDTRDIQANVFHSGDLQLAMRLTPQTPRSILDLTQMLEKPEELSFRYSGGSELRTAQESGKTSLWGHPDDDPLAYLILTDAKDPGKILEGKDTPYFSGSLSWGQQLTATAAAAGKDHFGSTTHLFLYDDEAAFRRGDAPLQQGTFVTSGAEPICLGDGLGPLTLLGYRAEDGERHLPEPVAVEGNTMVTLEAGSPLLVSVEVSNPGQLTLKDIQLQSPNGLSPHWMGGDTNANGRLDPGEVWTYLAMETARLGPSPMTMTLQGVASTPEGESLNLPILRDQASSASVGAPPVPAGDLGRLFGDASALTFRYVATGDILTGGKGNDQNGKATCIGTAPGVDSSAYIVACGSDDVAKVKDGDKPLYFAGTVDVGQSFTASLAFTHQKTFPNDLHLLIFEDEEAFLAGSPPLQLATYHTGGSQPMSISDRIGAVQLEGYVGTDGGYAAAEADPVTGTVGKGFSLAGVLGEPQALTFLYDNTTDLLTGGEGFNQDGKAAIIGGRTADADGLSFLRVSDRKLPDDLRGREYFEGMLSVGDTFTASLTASGAMAKEFPDILYIHYFDHPGGPSLGSVAYSTSGSQPIHLGDRLAGSTLVGFLSENGSAQLA